MNKNLLKSIIVRNGDSGKSPCRVFEYDKWDVLAENQRKKGSRVYGRRNIKDKDKISAERNGYRSNFFHIKVS